MAAEAIKCNAEVEKTLHSGLVDHQRSSADRRFTLSVVAVFSWRNVLQGCLSAVPRWNLCHGQGCGQPCRFPPKCLLVLDLGAMVMLFLAWWI